MLEKSFGLLFYLKKPKKYHGGKMPVYLRITVDGVAKEMVTHRKCEPERWNAQSQRVKGMKLEHKMLNAHLDTLERKVHDVKVQLIESGKPITSAILRNALLGIEDDTRTILDVFRDHNKQMKALVGKEFSPGTLQRYETSLEHTRSFIQWKYNKEDMDIRSLNFEFVTEYEFWLKSVRKCNHNTAIKYISNFRKIVNRCIRNGWLTKDPFLGFKMTKREVERIALTHEELKAMASKEFVMERLNLVRDIFLFCCFTGLAYSDVKKLKRSEIGKGIDGNKWIFTSRKKTETASRIPLLPVSAEILNKYEEHPQCVNEGKALPVPSNQKMNAYLKEIADVCGISKNLTFHIARHTFATTVTLSNGVPIETISKMLGHTNLKTTQIYAKVMDKKISDDMNTLKNRLRSI